MVCRNETVAGAAAPVVVFLTSKSVPNVEVGELSDEITVLPCRKAAQVLALVA